VCRLVSGLSLSRQYRRFSRDYYWDPLFPGPLLRDLEFAKTFGAAQFILLASDRVGVSLKCFALQQSEISFQCFGERLDNLGVAGRRHGPGRQQPLGACYEPPKWRVVLEVNVVARQWALQRNVLHVVFVRCCDALFVDAKATEFEKEMLAYTAFVVTIHDVHRDTPMPFAWQISLGRAFPLSAYAMFCRTRGRCADHLSVAIHHWPGTTDPTARPAASSTPASVRLSYGSPMVGSNLAAHYLHGYAEYDGIMFLRLRKVFPRNSDNRVDTAIGHESLLIGIQFDGNYTLT
jgi:hypothetical protein